MKKQQLMKISCCFSLMTVHNIKFKINEQLNRDKIRKENRESKTL